MGSRSCSEMLEADRLIGMIGCFGVSNENGVALEMSVS